MLELEKYCRDFMKDNEGSNNGGLMSLFYFFGTF